MGKLFSLARLLGISVILNLLLMGIHFFPPYVLGDEVIWIVSFLG